MSEQDILFTMLMSIAFGTDPFVIEESLKAKGIIKAPVIVDTNN